MSHVKSSATGSTRNNKGKQYMGKKLKLNDKAIEEHISDWSYVTKDKDGNKVIKQKRD